MLLSALPLTHSLCLSLFLALWWSNVVRARFESWHNQNQYTISSDHRSASSLNETFLFLHRFDFCLFVLSVYEWLFATYTQRESVFFRMRFDMIVKCLESQGSIYIHMYRCFLIDIFAKKKINSCKQKIPANDNDVLFAFLSEFSLWSTLILQT